MWSLSCYYLLTSWMVLGHFYPKILREAAASPNEIARGDFSGLTRNLFIFLLLTCATVGGRVAMVYLPRGAISFSQGMRLLLFLAITSAVFYLYAHIFQLKNAYNETK